MFANFKISGQGAMNPVASPKIHKRTATGCLPCRTKKKKCDEQKPICRRCQKWSSRGQCQWPADLFSRRCRNSRQSQRSLSLELDTVTLKPDIIFLARYFENSHAVPYAGPGSSLIDAYSSCTQWATLAHAYATCGAAMLFNLDGPWQQLSLSHYLAAIQSLSTDLSQDDSEGAQECVLAVINTLHMFETLRHDAGPRNQAHLLAGWELYLHHFKGWLPRTLEQKLLLEEFAFQLAVSTTFHAALFTDDSQYWDMQHFLAALRGSSREPIWSTWGDFADMGICHDIFDHIFRLSFLRTRVPLQGQHSKEAANIMAELQAWEAPDRNSSSHEDPGFSTSLLAMAHMYRFACLVLATKVIAPLVTSSDPLVRSYVSQGLMYARGMVDGEGPELVSVLLWPITMFGIAAEHQRDRDLCKRLLKQLLVCKGIGSIREILTLLDHAWREDDQGALGLDILFRDDLLAIVMF